MSDLTEFKPDPKPEPSVGGMGRPKRNRPTLATPTIVGAIKAQKCGECRLCGDRERVDPHHLIPRGMGGTIGGEWTADNIVGLCRTCHDLVEARDPAANYLLRASLTDAEYAYVVSVAGEGWLERRYPVRPLDTSTTTPEASPNV